MPGPLSHLRVVELCDGLSVSYCGRQFAQWGAEVVMLEPPGGSPIRSLAPMAYGPSADALPNVGEAFRPPAGRRRAAPAITGNLKVTGDQSLQWEYLSANKRLKAFDPADPLSGNEVAGLVGEADVFVTDWPWQRLAEAGLRPDDLSGRHPGLIVLSFSDFGRTGPYAGYKGADIVLQAVTGYMSFNGERGRVPLKAPANVLPYAAGITSFLGTLAALWDRARVGRGQVVEVTAMEAMAGLVQYTWTQYFQRTFVRRGGVGPPMLPCKDGWIFFNYMLEMGREPLLVALGLDAADVPPEPAAAREFFARHTRERTAMEMFEALALLRATCAMAQSPASLLESEHLAARGFFRRLQRPEGAVPYPGPPANMSETPALAPEPARPFDGCPARAAGPPPAQPPTSAGPLSGLRVLDLTQAWLGPYAAMLLADLGAEVIKTESPLRPDVWRNVSELPPVAREGAHRWNTCHFFNSVNRNKRSLTLDLEEPRGKELFLRLVRDSDLVLENFTPRVMENFGLGYERLRRENPRLVMASFSGYGNSGPYSSFKATGASIEVVAGWVALFGYPGEPPMTMGEYQIDPMAGLQMASTALAALLHREVSGLGQHIEGSMIEAAVGYVGDEMLLAAVQPQDAPRGNGHRQYAPHGVFPSAGEDQWVAIAVRDEDEWRSLRAVVGGSLLLQPRFDDVAARRACNQEIEAEIARWSALRGAADAMSALQAAGVPAGAFRTTAEALEDAHLAERGWFKTMTHPDVGAHKYYGFPWSFSRSQLSALLPPPRLGEHSAPLLTRKLALSGAEIEALVSAKVTGAVIDASDHAMPERRGAARS